MKETENKLEKKKRRGGEREEMKGKEPEFSAHTRQKELGYLVA